MKRTVPLALLLIALAGSAPRSIVAQRAASEHWVGTWATAVVQQPALPPTGPARGDSRGRGQQGPPPQPPATIVDQTLRQIVHASIGGDRVRVVFTNAFGSEPLAIGAAHIALREKDARIAGRSDRTLTFDGRGSATIPPGAVLVSDPVSLSVPALSDVAVDLYLPGPVLPAILASATPISPPTMHQGALQTSYISATGNHAGEADLPVMRTMQSWFFLARVEVAAPASVGAVVTFGDSITDGTRSTPDTNNRWPDHLARRLMALPANARLAVLNEGIAGNRVLSDGAGKSALARFDRDALVETGVTHIVVLEGINDFGLGGASGPSAQDVIAGLEQLVERAHARGLAIIGATLLPFEGTTFPNYYSPENDAKRQMVNDWIRSGKAFDGVIDFDAAMRDPSHPSRLLPKYKAEDNLHLNDAGYEAMANAVNLALFAKR